MGFTEIYLIGVDFEYSIPDSARVDGLTITSAEDDHNHFHPDYFGKGKRWHLPKLENVERAMACAKESVETAGGRIFNATVGGRLELFHRVDYHELVGRPQVPEPNSPRCYVVARALERAARLGATTVAVDARSASSPIASIVSASPLRRVNGDADVLLQSVTTPSPPHEPARNRVLQVLRPRRPE